MGMAERGRGSRMCRNRSTHAPRTPLPATSPYPRSKNTAGFPRRCRTCETSVPSGRVAFQPFAQAGLGGAGADLHVGRFPALEQDHGGNGADAILGSDAGILIDIELDDLHLAGKLSG